MELFGFLATIPLKAAMASSYFFSFASCTAVFISDCAADLPPAALHAEGHEKGRAGQDGSCLHHSILRAPMTRAPLDIDIIEVPTRDRGWDRPRRPRQTRAGGARTIRRRRRPHPRSDSTTT